MTSQSPRIYTYKITFEEVPYYYYGVKKEKYFNQEYWGSPSTHKWCWELYTPKKQILELFDYTDGGYIEAQEVEKRLIKPVLNDKWCLNESCGGKVSSKVSGENGKKIAQKNKKNKTAIFGMTKEELSIAGKKGGNKIYNKKLGMFGISQEVRSEISKKVGNKCKEFGLGICGLSFDELSAAGKKGYKNGLAKLDINKKKEIGRKAGIRCKENKIGIFALTKEQRSEISKRTASQKWICLETGYVSNAGGLSTYQKARGIDTSKRKRIL
jgi:hypothetical protein